jgi:hypothetical protein
MNKLMTAAGIALGGVLLWLALRGADLAGMTASLRSADPIPAIPLLVSAAAFYLLKAARWKDILSPTLRIRARELVPSMMAGAAGNNLLPAHMGEFVRAYILGHQHGVSKAALLATLAVERLFDIIAVLLLFSAALLSVDFAASLRPAMAFLLAVAIIGSATVYLLARHPDRMVGIARTLAGQLPAALAARVSALADRVVLGFRALHDPRLFLRILVNSVVQWALMSVCIYMALNAFAIDVPFQAAVVVLACVVAGLTLPTSPGYVGTIQYGFVLALAPFGVDSTQALAASLFYHTLLWVSVTATGLGYLRSCGVTLAALGRLRRGASDRQAGTSGERT